ncbi:MAG: transcription termination factor NusA [Candidatus Omnitrophota bacterium]|nr:transcription termination factor NusA [Candidatus Omnitrophota bacterium]
MNGEILAILEQLERDKGIKKELLIAALESAMVSAIRKVLTVDPTVEIKVNLDTETGKIKAYAGDEEIKSGDFGRIAAQTAKQVIIQKIREAEKDVIFVEYQNRIGQIVSGSVYRFDKGSIVVDLGKTEGFLPRSEQSGKEEFHQGERIRAYVLEVKKESKGPQVILSRSHSNFIKRLFELEVPEIYEGIVEVKSISREAGERTKIAVLSKDEKVDSVGACVGMRGSRVKSIVSELHGEKIDIVRYSEDMREYITAAISPAKISEIRLDKANQKADVIVDDDQLSLAIGRHGQNVRLASKLVGWELNIRPKVAAAVPAEEKLEKKETPDLTSLEGVGEKLSQALVDAGFNSLSAIAQAKVEDLIKVKGVGEKKAEKLILQAQKSTAKEEKEVKKPAKKVRTKAKAASKIKEEEKE